MYIYSKLARVVEGDQEAPFSIATTLERAQLISQDCSPLALLCTLYC